MSIFEKQELREQRKIEEEQLNAEQQMHDEGVMIVGDEFCTPEQLVAIVRENKRLKERLAKLTVHKGDTYCPLCGSGFLENDLFVCDCCGELLVNEERCNEHWEFSDKQVCQSCCESCQDQKVYEQYTNNEIDFHRGK